MASLRQLVKIPVRYAYAFAYFEIFSDFLFISAVFTELSSKINNIFFALGIDFSGKIVYNITVSI